MKTNIILAALLLTTLCAQGADVKEGIYEYDVISPTAVKLTKVSLALDKDTVKLVVPQTVMLQHRELTVTTIGQRAFESLAADSIILPSSPVVFIVIFRLVASPLPSVALRIPSSSGFQESREIVKHIAHLSFSSFNS